MAHGQDVTLIPNQQAISTQRSTDILGMSRPFFIKLLETRVMPYHRFGNQRRIYLRDVLEFGRKRDQERLAALDCLSRDAFESGLYRTEEELKICCLSLTFILKAFTALVNTSIGPNCGSALLHADSQ